MNFSYVDQVNQNLICSICCSPFHEPVTTPCQHTFCLNCFHSHFEAREGTAACPLCNSAIELAWTQSKIVSLMVDELEVFCENKDAGCPWTGQRQLFQSHVNICHFIFKNCGNSGCEFQAFDLSIHANECQYALDECSSCQLKMERRDLAVNLFLTIATF